MKYIKLYYITLGKVKKKVIEKVITQSLLQSSTYLVEKDIIIKMHYIIINLTDNIV